MPDKEILTTNVSLDATLVNVAITANRRSLFVQNLIHSTIVKVLGTTFLLVALFSISFLLAYQQIRKKEMQDALKQVPAAEINIVDYVNQQNDWKQYTNSSLGLAFQYPPNIEVKLYPTDSQEVYVSIPLMDLMQNDTHLSSLYYYNNPEELGVTEYENQRKKIEKYEQVPSVYLKTDSEKKLDNGINIWVRENSLCEPVECTLYIFTFNKKIFVFPSFTRESNSIVEQIIGHIQPQENNKSTFCGGIAAIECPSGFRCQLDGTYPDAGGSCIKN